MNRKYSTSVLIAGFSLAFDALAIQADPKNLELASPKNVPSNWVRPYEPCLAVTNYSTSKPDDIVLFIAGTLNGKGKWYYAISETLFSKADLTKKVDQLDDCIMKPSEPYENGSFRNCLWMHCIIQHNNQWMMYYGAGDRNVGLATAPVK